MPKRPVKAKAQRAPAKARQAAKSKPARAKPKASGQNIDQLTDLVRQARERATLHAVRVLHRALEQRIEVVRRELMLHLQAIEAAQRKRAE